MGLVGLVAASSGCTLLGLTIGAATGEASPRYEPVGPDTPSLSTGMRVRVLVAYDLSEDWVEGRYSGVRDGALIVTNARGEAAIPLERAREVRVRNGTNIVNGVVIGGAVGAALDVATFIALAGYAERGCCAPR